MKESSKTICIIQNSIKTLANFRISYIKELLSRGFSVVVIAPNDDQVSANLLKSCGVEVRTTNSSNILLRSLFINIQMIRLMLAENKRVIFVCHFVVTFVMSIPALLFANKKILFIEGVGSFFSKRHFFSKILKFLVKNIPNKTVFMNSYEKGLLGCKSDLVLGGIGVDLLEFCDENFNVSKPSSHIRLLYIGRLVEDKGILDVLNLARLLMKENVDYKLDVVGDIHPGNPSTLSEEQLSLLEKELAGNVQFHGYKSEVKEFYKRADVLLLLSKHEGFPVVVMESNAMGVPVLAYRVPGCEDAVCEGVNGYLANLSNIEEVKDLIVGNDWCKLRESSRKYALDKFDRRQKDEIILRSILE
ncbi:glycosyltransferase [Vibrio alginolyticus]